MLSRGQRALPLTLGVDLGGTKLLACLVDGEDRVRAEMREPTGRHTSPGAVIERIAALVTELRRQALAPAAIGIGVPGLVDHARGLVLSSIMLDGWKGVALAHLVERETGLPCTIDNDVNMAALCELERRGPAVSWGNQAMLFVAVGTGIGGALCLGGRLWRGASGVAGEIGNLSVDPRGRPCWCGRHGCLNTVASGSAIEAAAGIPPGTLGERWQRRERAVVDAVLAGARALGAGLADAIHLLNPALVVIGGGVAELGEGYLAEVRRHLATEAFPEAMQACRIEASRAGYAAGALGAARLAAMAVSNIGGAS